MAYKQSENKFHTDKDPDTCPACGKGISPISCYSYGINTWRKYEGFLQVVFRCPREECNRLFIAKYVNSDSIDGTLFLDKTYLLDLIELENFPDSINEFSVDFTKIYNEAKIAEDNGLTLIAGPGYRKALEFLVKDYLIKIKPAKAEKIKEMPLGNVIKLIEEKRIESCASRAAWVGNDETHYNRKWIDKDIQDLKNLIKMVVDWIDLVDRSDEYEEAMPSKALGK